MSTDQWPPCGYDTQATGTGQLLVCTRCGALVGTGRATSPARCGTKTKAAASRRARFISSRSPGPERDPMKAALFGLVGSVVGCAVIAWAVNAWLDHALGDVLSGRLH